MTESGLQRVPTESLQCPGLPTTLLMLRDELHLPMPLKHHDPFVSSAERLNEKVNPYVALLRESAAEGSLPVAFGPLLKTMPGAWREKIAEFHKNPVSPKKLVLEIGCHKGLTLTTMAKAFPETYFVGMDITFKRVVTTAQRAHQLALKNTFCVMANAQGLERLFSPGELDAVVIFFPDPWIKKARQAKNRLVSGAFAASLAKVLAPGGMVWFKSDQELYFKEASQAFEDHGLQPIEIETSPLLTQDFTSAFELRFSAQGLPTFGGRWLKPLT